MATGIYSRLDAQPEISGPGELTLHLSGAEARPRTLGIFGGFETFSGPILGVETRHVNFGNTGDLLAAKAGFTARGLDSALQWLNPAIFGSRNSLGLDLSATTFSFKAYDRRTVALRATLSRRFSQEISAEVFGGYALSSVESAELSAAELGPSDYGTADLGARVTFDFRDVPLAPHRGWLFNGSIDAVGGDVQFARLDTSIAYYHPLAEHWRFALGAKSSALYGSGTLAEAPIDLRLFNGGANNVRSFPERELGGISAVGETPLGGLASQVVSAELSYEIISNLELAAFADAGGLNQKAASLLHVDDWKYAVGLGIRYNLPIGPLRIDYGFNPQRSAGEPSGTLHVTFGFAF